MVRTYLPMKPSQTPRYFTQSSLIQLGAISYTLGIAVGFFVSCSTALVLVATCCIVVVSCVWRDMRIIAGTAILLALPLCGMIRTGMVLAPPLQNQIAYYNGTHATVRGIIAVPPDIREDKTLLTIETERIVWQNREETVSGKVLIQTGRYFEGGYGDRISVKGRLATPPEFPDFSYKNYLAKENIGTMIESTSVNIEASRQGSLFFEYLYAIRKSLENRINLILPEPHSSLMSGILLGVRRNIPERFLSDLQTTGLTHMIALSGFNITILITFIAGGLLKRARPLLRYGGAMVIIVIFTLMVGAGPSILRAAIMGLLGLLALWHGRTAQILTMLLLTLAVMVTLEPRSLLYDVGFQLSFLATLGLILLTKPLEPFFSKLPERLGIRETLLSTFAAQIMVLPILFGNFGQVSLISPLSNLVVLWIIPLTMLLGSAALFIAFIPLVGILIAKIIGFGCWLCLTYVILVIQGLAKVPLAALPITWWRDWMSWLFYLVLAAELWRRQRQDRKKENTEKVQTSAAETGP